METPSRRAFITNIRMGPTAPEKGKGKEKGVQLPGAGWGAARGNDGIEFPPPMRVGFHPRRVIGRIGRIRRLRRMPIIIAGKESLCLMSL